MKVLTWLFRRDPPAQPEPLRHGQRIARLEIELEDQRTLLDAIWARQRKVEGAVHGMRGASSRWPGRGKGDTADESLEDFRDRMRREGRMGPTVTTEVSNEE